LGQIGIVFFFLPSGNNNDGPNNIEMKAQNLAAIINSSRTSTKRGWYLIFSWPHCLHSFMKVGLHGQQRMMREMRLYSRESSFCCFKKRKEGRGMGGEGGRKETSWESWNDNGKTHTHTRRRWNLKKKKLPRNQVENRHYLSYV
jgi:hypothetical protein